MNSEIEIIIPEKEIIKRVKTLSREIEQEYDSGKHNADIVVLGILTGVFVFLSDLMRNIQIPISLDFLGLSRYREGHNPGQIQIYYEPHTSLKGKRVLIVDSILDKGITLEYAHHYVNMYQPQDIKTCVLLEKKTERDSIIKTDFRGFFVQDVFVFGYGLDFNGQYRNLPYIGFQKSGTCNNL